MRPFSQAVGGGSLALEYIEILDGGAALRKVGVRGLTGDIKVQVLVPYQENRSDTFTAAANGTTVSVIEVPCSRFGIQVKATGSVTSWDVRLEGSLDGTTFTTLLTHTNTLPGDGLLWMQSMAAPVKYFRSRCHAITLGAGTNVIATIIGEAGS